ncbi:unnamed protein product [Rotaria magnacalcarata]|uniref:Uncharacterized protein n=1 Tax=Rotaria magnacalcarata TaxID=392030 RepID=A0A814FCZ5_9BILA|nr:unnamed protein product [Rotaria magnacalcarata]
MNANETKKTPITRGKYQLDKIVCNLLKNCLLTFCFALLLNNQLKKKAKRSSNTADRATSPLPSVHVEEFFKATEDGSIERLQRLFDEQKDADPNMTHFMESLLMAAIRRERLEVAEYLIDQLTINVKYATNLHEFRVRKANPIRQRTFSCRDLAYEKGMMELVDLIDITNDEVKPSIKRHLRKRLQARLDSIRETYLKRLAEQKNVQLMLPPTEEKDTSGLSITDRSDDKMTQQSTPILPMLERPQRSRIIDTVQSIEETIDRSIDETGKKSFHFSNYSLRFRLVETQDKDKKLKEQSKISTTIPSLPIIKLSSSNSPLPLTTTNSTRRSISEASARLSMRDRSTSGCDSVRQTTIPETLCIDNKSSTTATTIASKHFRSKYANRKYIKPTYIPQQQDTFYSQTQRFLPVTLKATAVGLPSDARIIRD